MKKWRRKWLCEMMKKCNDSNEEEEVLLMKVMVVLMSIEEE